MWKELEITFIVQRHVVPRSSCFLCVHPRQWSEAAVAAWLRWAAREFSLEGVALQQFARAQGKDICAMGREEFVARAPAFMGDILWEHLEILQKDVEKERSLLANVPPNMYESNVCLPELADYIPPPAHHYNNNNNNTGMPIIIKHQPEMLPADSCQRLQRYHK
ncbi:ETS protein pointed isoform P2 [Danaus plexippus plexippus]|uniref:ETS protein pointed isoform P2 n=1 Tax=Danaus plexippus plexippus TaxID=278856 RepID=A0A212ENN3_DANPL|nr:ETS protein pointed isoform P2 [Danaus plexippus plexippus]